MATVSYSDRNLIVGNEIYTWAAMAAGDDGAPAGVTGSGDRTVQIRGTFGAGGTVLIEGTLDMANWDTLRDPAGAPLSFSAAGIKTVLENVVAIRPRIATGDGTTSINVVIAVRRDRNG